MDLIPKKFERSAESSAVLNEYGQIIGISPSMTRFLHSFFQKSPHLGDYFVDFLPREEQEEFQVNFDQIWKRNQPACLLHIPANSSLLFTLAPLLGSKDQIQGVMVHVSGSHLPLLATTWPFRPAMEARFQRILHAISFPIFILNPQNEVIGINPMAEKVFQWKEEEILGIPMDDLIPPNFHEDLLMSSWESFFLHLSANDNNHEILEIKLPGNTGITYFEVYANQFEFQGIQQTVVMFLDISGHIHYSRVIQNQLDLLQEVAFVQSHVIRSPLAKVLGIVDLLMQEAETSPEERKELLNLLSESAGELDKVIQQLVNQVGR